jgi:hypothetical protein
MSVDPSVVVTISDVTMEFAAGQFVPVEFAYMRLPTI